jgi:hypothetical protein
MAPQRAIQSADSSASCTVGSDEFTLRRKMGAFWPSIYYGIATGRTEPSACGTNHHDHLHALAP